MVISKNNQISPLFKIERSNELNSLSPRGMSLTEIRFLAIYQAKINARKPDTRKVSFKLRDFCEVMEIKELNVAHIKKVADDIICNPVHIPDGQGGMYIVPLFTKCHIHTDEETNEWVVDIQCSKEVLPYMFEMKRNYFTYELWNALTLTSINQVRMYEILKQYEKIGSRTIELDELKRLLGLQPKQYERFKDFRKYVIEACQKALRESTDILFDFQLIKTGRKVTAIEFNITRNTNFKDNLKLRDFINPEDLEDIADLEDFPIDVDGFMEEEDLEEVQESQEVLEPPEEEVLNTLYHRCNGAYTMHELKGLFDYVKGSGIDLNTSADNYVYVAYCDAINSNNSIKNMYKYTLRIIQQRLSERFYAKDTSVKPTPKVVVKPTNPSKKTYNNTAKKSPKIEVNYDLNEFMVMSQTRPRCMSGHSVLVYDALMNPVGYIYDYDFQTIRDGSWKEKYPNCSLDGHTSLGIAVRDLMDGNFPIDDLPKGKK